MKGTIILIESVVLILLVIFLLYGYGQYSNLKTEFESFTSFGDAKIKLPIDSDYEAVLVAQNTDEYKRYYLEEKTRKEIRGELIEGDQLYFHVSSSRNSKAYTLVFELMPSTYELVLNIDAETG